jgi:hypothetical protein
MGRRRTGAQPVYLARCHPDYPWEAGAFVFTAMLTDTERKGRRHGLAAWVPDLFRDHAAGQEEYVRQLEHVVDQAEHEDVDAIVAIVRGIGMRASMEEEDYATWLQRPDAPARQGWERHVLQLRARARELARGAISEWQATLANESPADRREARGRLRRVRRAAASRRLGRPSTQVGEDRDVVASYWQATFRLAQVLGVIEHFGGDLEARFRLACDVGELPALAAEVGITLEDLSRPMGFLPDGTVLWIPRQRARPEALAHLVTARRHHLTSLQLDDLLARYRLSKPPK